LRAHVVWFGESVPMIETASEICESADIFVLVGSSLAVYPAAGLINFVPSQSPRYIIDPKIPEVRNRKQVIRIEKTATEGLKDLLQLLT